MYSTSPLEADQMPGTREARIRIDRDVDGKYNDRDITAIKRNMDQTKAR
jgi:hypothetical protein